MEPRKIIDYGTYCVFIEDESMSGHLKLRIGEGTRSFSAILTTVRLRVHSGEIVTGQVVHTWEEKSVQMVRVASGQLVYNVPASMLVDETKTK